MLLHLQDNRGLGIPAPDSSQPVCVSDSKHIPQRVFPKLRVVSYAGRQAAHVYLRVRQALHALFTHRPDSWQSLLGRGRTGVLTLRERKQKTQRLSDWSKVGPGL